MWGICRPDGADFILVWGSTIDAAPMALGNATKITQPFMAGHRRTYPTKSRQGRKKSRQLQRFCRPWTGLWTLPKREPSHERLVLTHIFFRLALDSPIWKE
jgi:hypothetical protein